MKRYQSVDEYIEGHPEWQAALIKLREIMQTADLTETVKWGAPAYTIDGKNVVGLGAFKSYVGIWFFQGVFLKDPQKKLINAQEGKTKALRQWRFDAADDIDPALVKAYVEEAIENQKAGKEMKPAKGKALIIPDELQQALDQSSVLKGKFNEFTLSNKRDFADYISTAKRAETRAKRLEKIIPMILENIGLNDKYK